MEEGNVEAKPVETDGPHKQLIKVTISTSTKARYYGRFQETFFVRIDGTLNWQKLTVRGTIVGPDQPAEKIAPPAELPER